MPVSLITQLLHTRRGLLIVLALDPPFGPDGSISTHDIVLNTCDLVSAYKVGIPLFLENGLNSIKNIKELCSKRVIADFKLADIGPVSSFILERLRELGADAVIAHGFVGLDGALDAVIETGKRVGLDIILVASMSHPGSRMFIDRHFEEIISIALETGVHGIVVAANKPNMVRRARELVGQKLFIYSPGVGVQGAEPGDAICAGANYEIIGRTITRSANPRKTLEETLSRVTERVRTCHG